MRTAFAWLAKFKRLRGTALDPFGRTEERRTERALIGEYRRAIEELLPQLREDTLPRAVEIARIPEEIRGFGHVKARHLAAARAKWARLTQAWRDAAAAQRCAA
jgi:indolepyruvate ferredoxin oxidoreductase